MHCFRVPSQDAREIVMLVNHGSERQEVKVMSGGASVRLSLASHLPGVVVSEAGKGVQAVESSGDVVVDGALERCGRSRVDGVELSCASA